MMLTPQRRPLRSLEGSFTALVTPFRDDADRTLDESALRRLVARQVVGKSDGVVVAGSTGEGALLRPEERERVVRVAVEEAAGRMAVIVGIGGASTRESCELAANAERNGADALLATTPSYVRPNQRGLVAHYHALSEASALPLVLYNIPKRTGVDLLPATVAELVATIPNVLAIKESASLERVHELLRAGAVHVLCGEDAWIAESLAAGARGAISVVGNLIPGRLAAILRDLRGLNGPTRVLGALERFRTLAPLLEALTLSANPVPVKAALHRLTLCPGAVRLPLVELERDELEALAAALDAFGTIQAVEARSF